MKDKFQYGKWTNDAFLLILKNALAVLSSLQDRAIYITFSTIRNGVILPNKIKAQYPKKMTIVLEHEFWDLSVLKTLFKVTVIFEDNIKSEIVIPFNAITSFSDKKAHVCFEFNHEWDEDNIEAEITHASNIVFLDEFRKS